MKTRHLAPTLRWRSATLLGLLLLGSTLLGSGRAQTHLALVRGSVVDPTGAAVPAASYRLTETATNGARTGVSAADGSLTEPQLRPGRYRLEVEVPGYRVAVREFTLAVDERLQLVIPLEVGPLTESVVVAAPAPRLDRAPRGLATVIDDQLVQTLPLDGRNFLELALLAAGTAPAARGSASSVRGDFAFSANGGREDANSFMLDGAYNVDQKLNTPGVRPPVDAIAEFKVHTNGYDASFGRHAGAQVNIITKSGGNDVHGTAYGFFRHRALTAANAFAPAGEPDPDYRRSQAGLSIGGPIVRDRTFFFADYEATRLEEGITRITNVPTAAERAGDFSQSLLPAPLNPFTRQPFPGGQIPAFFQHPVGQAIAALYPAPNRAQPFANYVSSPTLTDDVDHVDLKIDHQLVPATRLSARYSLSDRRLFEPFSGPGFPVVPGFGTDVPRRAHNAVVSATQVLTPAMVHDTRVVFNRVSSGARQENQGRNLNQQVGLPNLSDDPRTWGLSQITLTGFSTLGDEFNNPQETALTTVQLLDTLTWSAGAHLLTLGGDLRFTRQDGFRDVQSRGFLNFTGLLTGNPLGDLLLGLPTVTGGARLDNPQRLRASSYNVFFQDDIQLRGDLTVSAGVRYEVNRPPVDADDRATLYDPATGTVVPVGTGGVPRGGYDADLNNVAPRLGVAWAATPRTVVRGGYGLFYDQSALAPGEGLYFNPPFFDFGLAFQFPGLPPLTLSDPFPAAFPVPTAPSALTFQRDLRTPFLQQWHTSVQRDLGPGQTVEIAYVGSRGHDLIRARDLNQPRPSAAPLNPRPDPRYADIIVIESAARSRYHALQITLAQRLRHGLTLRSAYTLAKSEDDASGFFTSAGDPNFPQDHAHPEREFGRSAFDMRHRLALSFAYALPMGEGARGWRARLVRDWQVAGVVTVESGQPFTVALLPTTDNSNTGRAALGFGFNDRPNLTGDPTLTTATAAAWFNTAAFTTPPFGRFGDAGRNILDGPGFRSVNLALLKHVRLDGGTRLELRLEAFNLLNTVNLGLPDALVGSPTFGQILGAGAARRVQLGAKLLF